MLEDFASVVIVCDNIGSVGTQIRHITYFIKGTWGHTNIHDTELFELGGVPCACVVISPKDAPAVIKYVESNPYPFVSMKFQETILGTKPAPAAAFYSSRDPSPNYPGLLKPDIMAPGSLILAAWIPNEIVGQIGTNVYLSNNYNMVSGTSMATPHFSSVVSLLKSAHQEWSPAAIRSALMTTANPLDNSNRPIQDRGYNFQVASPLAMGAGQIDPNRALDPGFIYDTTYITRHTTSIFCATYIYA